MGVLASPPYLPLCAALYTLFATPIYSADALVQIEQNTGSSLVQDIGSALANKPPASDAEIQLIRSRLVLGKTVTISDLDISSHQKYSFDFWCRLGPSDGTQNETVNVTTLCERDGGSNLYVDGADDKSYQLTSDGGFSARGGGPDAEKRRRNDDGWSDSRQSG